MARNESTSTLRKCLSMLHRLARRLVLRIGFALQRMARRLAYWGFPKLAFRTTEIAHWAFFFVATGSRSRQDIVRSIRSNVLGSFALKVLILSFFALLQWRSGAFKTLALLSTISSSISFILAIRAKARLWTKSFSYLDEAVGFVLLSVISEHLAGLS